MSGIEVQHEGLEWVQEAYDLNVNNSSVFIDSNSGGKVTKNLTYKFELKPSYSIFSIRKDSPADLAGLMIGDQIISINDRDTHDYKLQEINEILKSGDNKSISMKVKRKNKTMTFKFKLKKIL